MKDRDICAVCGRPLRRGEPRTEIVGWAARMLCVAGGVAHYSCLSRAVNEKSYKMGQLPWNIQRPHPALVNAVESGILQPGTVFIPGPGLGDNALYLAEHGFDVTAVDISETAVTLLRRRAEKKRLNIEVLVGEVIFGLETMRERFDYVIERSFLQTIPAGLRTQYFRTVARLLKTRGQYVGIVRGPRDPPPTSQPYAFSEDDIRQLLAERFHIIEIRPTISGHDDTELDFWFIRAHLKPIWESHWGRRNGTVQTRTET